MYLQYNAKSENLNQIFISYINSIEHYNLNFVKYMNIINKCALKKGNVTICPKKKGGRVEGKYWLPIK